MPRKHDRNEVRRRPPVRRSTRLQSNHSHHETSRFQPTVVVPAAAAAKNSSPSDNASQETVNSSSPSEEVSLERNVASKKRPALGEGTNNRRQRLRTVDPTKPRRSLDTASIRRSPRLLTIKDNNDTTVTPSPALKPSMTSHLRDESVGSNTSNGSFSKATSISSKPRSYKSQEKRPQMPEGVVDLYPSSSTQHKLCACRQNHCSPHAISEAYLASYGWDHSKNLKARERSLFSASSHYEESSMCSEKATRSDRGTFSPSQSVSDLSLLSSSSNEDNTDMNYMSRQPYLTPEMRSILMDWLIELAEEYSLHPRTLQLAVTIVDKSLAKVKPWCRDSDTSGGFIVKKTMLQCLGCSCMWIACKLEELEPPSVDDFVYISDSSYTRQQISDMEMSVCVAHEFRLWYVTPFCYVHEFLRAGQACALHRCLGASSNPLLETMVLYLLELSLLPYKLVMKKPSLIAASAVYLARATLGISDGPGFWTPTLQHYTGYAADDLEETVLAIHKCQQEAEESELKSVYAKYKKPKYMQVSLKTVLHADDLGF